MASITAFASTEDKVEDCRQAIKIGKSMGEPRDFKQKVCPQTRPSAEPAEAEEPAWPSVASIAASASTEDKVEDCRQAIKIGKSMGEPRDFKQKVRPQTQKVRPQPDFLNWG